MSSTSRRPRRPTGRRRYPPPPATSAVPGDLVPVERRGHMAAELDAGRRRGLRHCGGTNHLRGPVTVGQHAEPLDRDLRGGLGPGRSVLAWLVDVDHRIQAGVEHRQHRIVPQGRLVQPGHHALLEQEGGPQPTGLDEPLRDRRERRAVGGGQRLRVPPRHRQAHVGAFAHRAQHPPDEGGVQERHVGGADEGRVGAVRDRGQPRRPGPGPVPGPPAGSWTTSTSGGSAGRSWPRARTTTTGPPVARARMPTVRRSSVDPCHFRPALGAPIRDDHPPASTTPA